MDQITSKENSENFFYENVYNGINEEGLWNMLRMYGLNLKAVETAKHPLIAKTVTGLILKFI